MTTESGIHWPAPPAALADRIVRPDHRDYPWMRSSYMRVGSPALVVRAISEDDVVATVRYAAAVRAAAGRQVPFSIRSGGHGIAGTSTNDGGLVLDLRALAAVDLDPATMQVTIGAGATWGEVAEALSPHGLVISSGNFGDTGVGGLATAGGIGFFARSQGLTLDVVRRVRLVTADGAIRWVDADTEPDLFWAVRGGGSQVGVATAFVMQATSLGAPGAPVIHQNVQYLVEDLPQFTTAWGEWIAAAPRQAESFLMLQRTHGSIFVDARTVWAGGDTAVAEPTLREALGLAHALGSTAQVVPYADIVPTPRQPHTGQQRIIMRDVLVDRADAVVGAAVGASLDDDITLLAELRALGGAVDDIPADATAWAGRGRAALAAIWTRPADDARVDAALAPLQALGTGMYGAYSSDTRPSAAELTWPGATGARLASIARRVDPDGLFDGGLAVRS